MDILSSDGAFSVWNRSERGLDMTEQMWIVILPSLVTGLITYAATKTTNKTNLAETNIKNATQLYQKYEELNKGLEAKVDRLEHQIEIMKTKYEKEIAFYQSEVERLEDENEELTTKLINIENELGKLKGGI